MSLGTLALIGICGLGGPLMSSAGGGAVPAIVGEILAGIVVGRTGFGVHGQPNAVVSQRRRVRDADAERRDERPRARAERARVAPRRRAPHRSPSLEKIVGDVLALLDRRLVDLA